MFTRNVYTNIPYIVKLNICIVAAPTSRASILTRSSLTNIFTTVMIKWKPNFSVFINIWWINYSRLKKTCSCSTN